MTSIRKKYILLAVAVAVLLSSCKKREVTSPVRKTIEEAVFASGYIEQENNYTVSASAEGIILSLPVKEGDSVLRKDLIVTIENDVQNNQLKDALAVYNDAVINASPDSPQLMNIQAQIDQAKQQLEFDKENYLRYESLRETNSVSQFDFEKAELQYQASQNHLTALQKSYMEVSNALQLNVQRSLVQVNTQKALLGDYKITTEESGTVISVYKKQGELIRRGEAIARIASGNYIIKLFVSENDITKVDIGQPVAVSINTYPNKTFPAKIAKIYPGFDETEQSYVVEARFEQLPDKMFSGTQLQANIATGAREDVLVVPAGYVSNGNLVRLKNGGDRQIITGSKNREWVEVISGISEKDLIVAPKN
jgi:multidrug efflux pump subunit AcrA (membrane-fusion protein)